MVYMITVILTSTTIESLSLLTWLFFFRPYDFFITTPHYHKQISVDSVMVVYYGSNIKL
jgi:hypothetical protein